MGRFSEQRDRVRDVSANGLDYREAPENDERNQKPTLAGIMPMPMRPATMPMPMPMPVLMPVPVPVPVRGICTVTCVLAIAVMLVRVRHGFESSTSGYILKTL